MSASVRFFVLVLLAILLFGIAAGARDDGGGIMASDAQEAGRIDLPKIMGEGEFPVEKALRTRRSVREFTEEELGIETISKLLWAAQGVTDERYGLRTAPSAGATYPLELYVATAAYLARYNPAKHDLTVTLDEDVRAELAQAALGQPWVESAPAVFVFAAMVSRTKEHYGDRAERYVMIEVGSASENLILEAVALGFGSVAVGAYDDEAVKKVLRLPEDQEVYLIVPVGKPVE
jgi:SagB-type dehydrogenase family enzyme